MCYPEIVNVKIKDTKTEFFKRERQKFKDVSNNYWKKYRVIAILKVIHKKSFTKRTIFSLVLFHTKIAIHRREELQT